MGRGSREDWGGTFLHWRNKKFRVFSNSKIFKKLSKNQCKISNFEKIFKFTYKNLNGKLIFTHFLSHLPGFLSFYTPLEHTKIFGVGLGGVVPPGLGILSIWEVGVWGLYKPLRSIYLILCLNSLPTAESLE